MQTFRMIAVGMIAIFAVSACGRSDISSSSASPVISDAPLASGPIERVEPPSWWIGFKEKRLTLLIKGDGVGRLDAVIDHKGVTVDAVRRPPNDGYLFLDLTIAPDATVGDVAISFSKDGASVARILYPLAARKQGSAERRGFNAADAIYLITPDRFANGDPENDSAPDMIEAVNRQSPGGRHGGDLRGIEERLDYIAGLGFTAIWLNPVLENNQPSYSYHGYATTDFYRVDPRFGDNAEIAKLAAAARARGMGLIMDMIVNHSGSNHWWTDNPPYPDWINFDGQFVQTNHQHMTSIDPYVAETDRRLFEDGWFDVHMPDLNQRNPDMATYLIQNAIWWIEHADLYGIRMDTYPYPEKGFMTEWSRRVMEEYPNFNIVGEEWTLNPALVAYWQRGKINHDGYVSYLPSLMDFPLQDALRLALTEEAGPQGGGLMRLYEALASDILYADPMNLVIFADNHDTDRVHTQLGRDPALTKIALAYLVTMRGAPQIYYGTEIAVANDKLNDHGDIRSNFPGGWKGDEVDGFNAAGLSDEAVDMQAYVRKLFQWRKSKNVIHDGALKHFVPTGPARRGDGLYVYFRYNATERVMVAINRSEAPLTLDPARYAEAIEGAKSGTEIISGRSIDLSAPFEAPAKSAMIVEINPTQ